MAWKWPKEPGESDLIYELFNGYLEAGPPTGELLKARNEVDEIVDMIYQHRMRLCNRAGLDFEDRDLEGIVSGYDQLNAVLARLMYQMGRLEGERSGQA